MKNAFCIAGVAALSALSLQAAETTITREGSKPWSVSASLRGFYDDNYNTSHSSLKRDTFGIEFSPSAKLTLQFEQTLLRLEYIYGMRYYEDRSDDPIDQTHEFDAFLRHHFSERYKVELADSFVIAQEPEVLESNGIINVPLRTEGDNIRNHATFDLFAQMTEIVGMVFGYANTFYDYEQDGMGSRSALLDRMQHMGTVNLRWQMQPTTVGILGYQYGETHYLSDEEIDFGIPADIRDTRTHYFYVGADHQFNQQLNGAARVGVQHTTWVNADEDKISPYVDLSATYLYAVGSHFQVGLRHSRNATDVGITAGGTDVTLDQESTTLYTSLSYQFNPKWTGTLLAQYQHSEFEGGLADGENDKYFSLGLNLAYEINNYWSAETGYNYDHLSSDIDFRSFDRNRVYVGLRVTY